MNEKIKNYLGVSGVVAIVVVSLSIGFFVYSFSEYMKPGSYRQFSADGEGKVTAIPDISVFNFSIITEGDKNIVAIRKENTEKNNKIIKFLKESGVEDKDIKTQVYNLVPRYQHFTCPINIQKTKPCPPAEIVGYTITQTVDVKIRDFDKIGIILTGVVENGANNVSQLSFSIDDPESLKNQAREKAITKAKEKAVKLAASAGFKLGRLISIDEGGLHVPYTYPALSGKAFDSQQEMMATVSPVIEPGSQEVIVNVTLRYEMK